MSRLGKQGEQIGLTGNRGSTTTLLLLLLLVVIGAAGYLYYFTDIIRPREGIEKTESVEQQPMTMPMPPRQTQMSTAQVPPKSAPQAAKPGSAPQPPQSEQKGQKGAPQASKPTPAEPREPQPQKPQAAAPEQKQGEKKAKSKHVYSLRVGTYVVDEKLEKDKEKVIKAGLEPIVVSGGTRKATMNRLFLGAFDDKQKAEAQLGKVKKVSDSAFMIQEKGKYAVYAGSYYVEKTAVQEQNRLGALGITLVLKKADVPLPAQKLTAGRFSSIKAAQEAASRLKKLGLKTPVIRVKD